MAFSWGALAVLPNLLVHYCLVHDLIYVFCNMLVFADLCARPMGTDDAYVCGLSQSLSPRCASLCLKNEC